MKILPLLLLVLLTGCATTAKVEDVAKLDYGPKPEGYKEAIVSVVKSVLKDPDSAQFRFTEPFQGYTRKAPLAGGGIKESGWVIRIHVNAKNSFGGYTGYKERQFLVRNNKIIGEIFRETIWKEEWLTLGNPFTTR